tara:strand:+ start:150 stop:503 length:354 start_codon:yes stop_codon:yes gene_type:complete
MPYTLEDDEIAILIKPMGNGRIGTCICKSDDHEMSDEQLADAMGVGLAMIGLFELLNDDDDEVYEDVRFALEERVELLLEENQVPMDDEDEDVPQSSYTSEGNVLTLSAFTKTKGNC